MKVIDLGCAEKQGLEVQKYSVVLDVCLLMSLFKETPHFYLLQSSESLFFSFIYKPIYLMFYGETGQGIFCLFVFVSYNCLIYGMMG